MRWILIVLLPIYSLCAMAPSAQEGKGHPIGVSTYSFYDRDRNRPITIEFWYPTDETVGAQVSEDALWVEPKELRNALIAKNAQKLPLILMSHGHGGDRRDRSWLAERLVRSGFVVASVDHYGNTWKTMNSIATLKFWERSQDISFALTKILSEPALETLIDPERIGFIGYSLGGMTGLYLAGAMPNELDQALASHKEVLSEFPPDTLSKVDFTPAKRSYCDSRIKAVLLLAPATWCFGKPQGFKDVHTPIGLVATLTDEVLPFHEHFHPLILHAIPARSKILKNGATHSAFLNRATKKGRAVLKEHLYRDPPGVDRLAIHEEVGTFAVDFFQQYLTPVQVLERVLSGK